MPFVGFETMVVVIMKILLVGNHACSNRGDAAILRGLISELRVQLPDIKMDILSRYPDSSSYILAEEVAEDRLYRFHNKKGQGINKLFMLLNKVIAPLFLCCQLHCRFFKIMPSYIRKQIKDLQSYDAVIQVGGSFFVDLYGVSQLEHGLCAILAKKPLFILGHSVGPFNNFVFKEAAKIVFSRAMMLSLRESVSLSVLSSSGFDVDRVHAGADTAWLVPPRKAPVLNIITDRINSKAAIAITMRDLAPFDRRLGVTQHEYEQAMAQLSDSIIAAGYQVIVFSTCTGIDSYHKDDRMVALRVGKMVASEDNYYVVMDELSDIEIGTMLSNCVLTIGTRLHSVIISMNYGTPAIAINYEHKSEGVMQQLGLDEYSQSISSILNGELFRSVVSMLENITAERIKTKLAVDRERSRASDMIAVALKKLKGQSCED